MTLQRSLSSLALLALVTVLPSAVLGQSSRAPATADRPTFEVADVHTSVHVQYHFVRGGTMTGDRYQLRDATMVDLISLAYKVDRANVIGGPAWLDFDRFDIYARPPRNTTRDTTQLMLQSLLYCTRVLTAGYVPSTVSRSGMYFS
jgi:hypothetical protein